MTSDGSIVPYVASPGFSEIRGGRKRRKSGTRRRSGKRSSRSSRKSRKYMKKMYRGGGPDPPNPPTPEGTGTGSAPQVNEAVSAPKVPDPVPDPDPDPDADPQGGGKRKHKGKTRKGKVSKWITHVKNFSRANKMDFRDALKNPKCKAEYHKMK